MSRSRLAVARTHFGFVLWPFATISVLGVYAFLALPLRDVTAVAGILFATVVHMVGGFAIGWGVPLGHKVVDAAQVELEGVRVSWRKGTALVPWSAMSGIEVVRHLSRVVGETRHILVHVGTEKGIEVYSLMGCWQAEAEGFIQEAARAAVRHLKRPVVGPFLSLSDPFVFAVLGRVVLWVGPPVLVVWLFLGGARLAILPTALAFVAGACLGTLARRVRLRSARVAIVRDSCTECPARVDSDGIAESPYRLAPYRSTIDTSALRRSERPYADALVRASATAGPRDVAADSVPSIADRGAATRSTPD